MWVISVLGTELYVTTMYKPYTIAIWAIVNVLESADQVLLSLHTRLPCRFDATAGGRNMNTLLENSRVS